jgi:uncharacterized membrane protein YfcA
MPAVKEHALTTRRLVATGLTGGVLSGLLGVGGGTIMVPMLVLWSRVPQREAHAISLAAIIPISAVGIAIYGAADEIRFLEGLVLVVGSMAGARMGARMLARSSERTLKLCFGIFLLVVAVGMVATR